MKFTKITAMVAAIFVAVMAYIPTEGVFSEEDTQQLELIVELEEPRGGSALFFLFSISPSEKDVAQACDVEIGDSYSNVMKGFSTTGTALDIKKLEATQGVKKVYVARTYSLPETFEAEEASETVLFSESSEAGEGTAVAVLDEGFLVTHEYFSSPIENPKLPMSQVKTLINSGKVMPGRVFSEKIPFSYDYANGDENVYYETSGGHGTHVAGIAGGKNSTRSGAAPGCQLFLMKVFTDKGYASDSKIIKAIDDAITLGVDAINLSLGTPCSGKYESMTIYYDEAFARARAAGITVCCSCGNESILGRKNNNLTNTDNYPTTDVTDYGTLASPAIAENALAVAGLTYSTYPSPNYSIGYYSSRGASPELSLKPDISAPGTNVISSTLFGSSLKTYGGKTGTSMASPFVAGSVAAIKGAIKPAHPQYDAKALERAASLAAASSAKVIRDAEGTVLSPRLQGAGMVDTQSAVQSPVILYGDSGSTKVSLYDKLPSTVTFDIYAENIGTENITYNIEGFAGTDDWEEKNGALYINGNTKEIEGTVFSFDCGNSVSIAAGETKKITVTAVFDEAQLASLAQVFTNGFFAEGYIFLKNSSLPEISIPYMGYFGSWASQCAVDGNGMLKELSFSDSSFKTYTVYNIEGKEKFIAMKSGDSIGMQNVPLLRNVVSCRLSVTDLNGNEFFGSGGLWEYQSKSCWSLNKGFSTYSIPSIILTKAGAILPQGEYYYTLSFETEYKQGTQQSTPFKIKTVVDDTPPQAVPVLRIEQERAYTAVQAQDNHGIQKITSGGSTENVNEVTGEGVMVAANISSGFTVYDFAGNSVAVDTTMKKGYICEYDENRKLLSVEIVQTPIVDGKPSVSIGEDVNRVIYVWNNMQPI